MATRSKGGFRKSGLPALNQTQSRGLCWQPRDRLLMEPRLGQGTSCPLLWAWEVKWLSGCKGIPVGCPHPSHHLPHPSMLSKWNLVKMRSLDNQRNRRNPVHTGTISGLWRGQCRVREVTPISIALILGAGKENSQCWFLWQERELPKPEPWGNQLRKLCRA